MPRIVVLFGDCKSHFQFIAAEYSTELLWTTVLATEVLSSSATNAFFPAWTIIFGPISGAFLERGRRAPLPLTPHRLFMACVRSSAQTVAGNSVNTVSIRDTYKKANEGYVTRSRVLILCSQQDGVPILDPFFQCFSRLWGCTCPKLLV